MARPPPRPRQDIPLRPPRHLDGAGTPATSEPHRNRCPAQSPIWSSKTSVGGSTLPSLT